MKGFQGIWLIKATREMEAELSLGKTQIKITVMKT